MSDDTGAGAQRLRERAGFILDASMLSEHVKDVIRELLSALDAALQPTSPTPEPPQRHTCITDDGGTPNRKCYACEAEKQPALEPPAQVELTDEHCADIIQLTREVAQERAKKEQLEQELTDAQQQIDVLKPGGTYAWKQRAEAVEAKITQLEQERIAFDAIVTGLTRERDAARANVATLDLKWHAASRFILNIVEAVGKPQPELESIVDLPALALEVVGQIEDYKCQVATLALREEPKP